MNNHHKDFNKILRELSTSQWQIDAFRDFLIMSHISIANQFYKNEEMEERYLEVQKRYNKEELEKFSQLLAITVMALNEKHQDFLGKSFMQNDMGNSYRGQFFTPFHISSMMAQINLHGIESCIADKGFFSLSEPACGSGGMILACDEVVTKAGHKSSEVMWVQAQDIDRLCFMMTYIQLSALDIPARVVLGNTLAMEELEVLYTPAFIREDWFSKIQNSDKAVNNPEYSDEQLKAYSSGLLF